MLWACLYVSDLPFVAAWSGFADDGPAVLVDGTAGRRVVRAGNAAALAAGVRCGQGLTAARALCPALRARPRRAAAEQALLEELAAWSYGCSSRVSPAPPQSILLEVGASLRLFGGWPGLERRLRAALSGMLSAPRLAAAPTAAAAWLLARHHDGICIDSRGPLLTALGQLPLHGCGLPAARVEALQGMGLRRLGQLFRLPRPELLRRIGAEALDWLDRLRGDAAEALPTWQPPQCFAQGIEFDAEIRGGDALLFPLRRLTMALAHMLTARDGGVQRFDMLLQHAGDNLTRVPVHLASPQRAATTLFELARTRLERVTLSAPVRALRLEARQLPDFRPGVRDLFEPVHGEGLDWPALCQRLEARLGAPALQQLVRVPEHRPERAWQQRPDGPVRGSVDLEPRPRPLWLLPRPRPLRGEVQVLSGPERLESGWWDGGDQRRDYFRVQTAAGQHAWAFRGVDGGDGWMLHGWFA